MSSWIRFSLCVLSCSLLALFVSSGTISAQVGKSGDPDYIFYKGNTLYEEGRYDEAIREYDVDGLVMFVNRSCRPMSIGQNQVVEMIREKYDLPVLFLEGDPADAEGFSWDDARNRVEGFIEILTARKK